MSWDLREVPLRCLRIHQIFWLVLLLRLISKLADSKPIDIGFGFGPALKLTGDCPPVPCARGRPQLIDCCDDAVSVSVGKIVVRVVRFLVTYAPRTSKFLLCCESTCTSITHVPADLNISISVTGSILTHDRSELIVISNWRSPWFSLCSARRN